MKVKLDAGAKAPNRAHNFKDLSGMRFGCLNVLYRCEDKVLKSGTRKTQYACRCDCGNTVKVIGESLKKGQKSCGCHRYDGFKEHSLKHGMRHERIYSIYCDMKKRCYNENCAGYKNYGGKGIKICNEWLNDFVVFYQWSIENGYTDTLTIDRIDSSGNYEPSNCRWVTRSENISRRNLEYWRKYHEGKVRFRGKTANESI